MAQAWGNLNAQNNQQCENCHSNGGEGFIATQQTSLFYNVVSTKKYFFLQYLTVDLTGGAPMAKVIVNTAFLQGRLGGPRPAPRAPAVQLDEQQGMTL